PLCRGSLFTVPPAAADALIPDPTPEDFAAATSCKKLLALLSGAASSHESEDEEDACVETPLNTSIRSVVAIPTDGN
ncbi:hypothetical protein Tco_0452105, partial [Tanacetum coccineum]